MNSESTEVFRSVKNTDLQLQHSGFGQSKIEKIFANPIWDTADLVVIFQRSERTIRRWCAAKKIKYIKIGGSRYYQRKDIIDEFNTSNKAD